MKEIGTEYDPPDEAAETKLYLPLKSNKVSMNGGPNEYIPQTIAAHNQS